MNSCIISLTRRYLNILMKQFKLIMRNKFHFKNIVRLINNKINRFTKRKTFRLINNIEMKITESNALNIKCFDMFYLVKCYLIYC